MESTCQGSNRRQFLKLGLTMGGAAMLGARLVRAAAAGAIPGTPAPVQAPVAASTAPTKVGLTHGDNRTDNVFRALKSVEKEIAQAIGSRRVIIKPNNVSITNQLAASHADALAGILDFLKSIGKIENAIIAESALGNTMQGFQNFGYTKLADKYNIKLVDLDQEKYDTLMAFSETDAVPHPVRVSTLLMDQKSNFIISACMLKTHDRAVATMGIKNIILGAPLKLGGGGMGGGRGPGGMGAGGPGAGGAGNMGPAMAAAAGGRGGRGGGGFGGSDKGIMHGGGAHGININLAMLAPLLHPSLTVIDGFQGMEGNGPISGTAVDHRVAVASTDYLAADVVGASLMGMDPPNIGYLSYLATAKVGEFDVTKMEILGEPIAKLAKKYQLGNSVQQQMQWKTPAKVSAT